MLALFYIVFTIFTCCVEYDWGMQFLFCFGWCKQEVICRHGDGESASTAVFHFWKIKVSEDFILQLSKVFFFFFFTSEKSCLEGLIVVSSATKSFWMFNKFEQKTLRKHAFAYVVIWSCADKWQRNNCFWIISTMRWSMDKVAGCEYFMLH